MKRYLTITTAAVAVGLLAAGCSDPTAGTGGTEPDAGPAQWPAQDTDLTGTTLTIWAAQNANTVPYPLIAGFEELTGAEVVVVTIPDPYEQGIQTKVATGD
jgi:raffinose/stachyose/melibiose transport system substrate-binding protein